MIKRHFWLIALLCALVGSLYAQNTTTFGNITAAGSPCGGANCVYYQLPPGTPWVVVTVSGAWSGTLEMATTSAPNANYSNLDTVAWTVLADETANGTWSASTSGATYLRVRATSWTSGGAQVGMASSASMAPLLNPVFPGRVTANGLAAPNGGSGASCWLTNGSYVACIGITAPVTIAQGGTYATTAAGAWTNIFSGAGIASNCTLIQNVAGVLTCSATTSGAALSSLGGVSTSTTVNGHALSSNVVVSAFDLTTGTLPHAQLPSLLSGDIPNNAANTSGTASNVTATSNSTLTSLPALTSANGTSIPASVTLLYSGGAAGTPSSLTLTNATGLPLTTGVTGTLPAANLPAATTSTLGGVKTDGSTIANSAGAISCTTATASQLGCVINRDVIHASFVGSPLTASQKFGYFVPDAEQTITVPASCTNSRAVAATAATASTTLTIYNCSTAFSTCSSAGTIVFAVSGTVGTFSCSSSFAITGSSSGGIYIQGPATADATLGNVAIALYGTHN